MKKLLPVFVSVGIILVVFVFSGAFYPVDETQQVVVTRFGEPMGKSITEAGLHFKMPFVDKANFFEKRLLQWDGDPNEIQTLGKRYIWVDTTARWKIVDALKFMQTVRSENSAQARLDDIIDGATRDVIASHKQVEALRNTNRLVEAFKSGELKGDDFDMGQTSFEKIKLGREKLSRKILAQSSKAIAAFGIELVDVRIKRINYIPDVRNKVYDRMISERKAVAAKYRSEGQGKKAEIEGKMVKELKEIQTEAYKKAQIIKGRGDAKAIKIYADAYNKDPDFYAFTKTLETYKKTIGKDTTFMFTTENEFYEGLQGFGGSVE